MAVGEGVIDVVKKDGVLIAVVCDCEFGLFREGHRQPDIHTGIWIYRMNGGLVSLARFAAVGYTEEAADGNFNGGLFLVVPICANDHSEQALRSAMSGHPDVPDDAGAFNVTKRNGLA